MLHFRISNNKLFKNTNKISLQIGFIKIIYANILKKSKYNKLLLI
jgi:hypothetical protein